MINRYHSNCCTICTTVLFKNQQYFLTIFVHYNCVIKYWMPLMIFFVIIKIRYIGVRITPKFIAVSYTHLDVYKRQVCLMNVSRRLINTVVSCKKLKIIIWECSWYIIQIVVYQVVRVTPVSYTHLDVYKRQIFSDHWYMCHIVHKHSPVHVILCICIQSSTLFQWPRVNYT